MTRKNDWVHPVRREPAHNRALLGTAIGLCLAIRSASSGQSVEIQNFTVRPEPGSVLLTWTRPPVTTFSRLVIRFRVDGPAPESLFAGFPLFDARTSPGAIYGTRHSCLSPHHAYSYTAFALDARGVVRASATAVATPLPLQVPATVRNLRRADVADVSVAVPAARGER